MLNGQAILRQCDIIFSLQRLALCPRAICVYFVFDKVVVGQVFLRLLYFSPMMYSD
jgi:hypothetical protein